MSPILIEDAPAKINLHLHVVGRREDGYHLVDSLVVFAAIGDRLTATPARDFSLSITGPFAASLDQGTDNLVLRAAQALAAATGVTPSGRVILEKHLPVASGVGGGSADAAAALRLLCRLWAVDPGPERLGLIALGLGADVPVCLFDEPARLAGIGERLSSSPTLPEAGIVLVNPGVAVATPSVFKARMGAFSLPAALPAGWPDAASLAATLHTIRNDLQPAARLIVPVIENVLMALSANPACLLTRMSGSGATCFGLYETASAAQAAAHAISEPGWWVWGGAIRRESRASAGS
ncbi:4-(cytidine 5'-diphospho)-2-C-methyl-D-erythritol kinase [Rhodopila sp.]|uniref:4-(cytidine 5'-diphospho)-2-C-methyl-D-erythritol kinase n=1 Tax=Rhodopila sp. TaxID=2480087 RepID=UPI003D11682C